MTRFLLSPRFVALLAAFAMLPFLPATDVAAQTRSAHLVGAEDEALVDTLAEPRVRDLMFSTDLGRKGDITLVGIYGYNSVTFGLPKHWELLGDPVLHLKFARSSQLLAEVSSLTVWADGRPVATFELDGDPGKIDEEEIALPLSSDDGYHTITFLAYHRTELPCEHAEHPGMWSRVLDSSFIRVEYRELAPELALSEWPYPFRDDREPDPSRVVLVVPEELGADEAQAVGYISSLLGHAAGWRAMDLYLHQGSPSTAPAGHMIAIARADAPSQTVSQVRAALLASPDDELRGAGQALRDGRIGDSGLLAIGPRPDDPGRAMLAVVGANGKGLVELARLLSGEEARKLPVGLVEYIDQVAPYDPLEERRWKGTVPPETAFTLEELGLNDRMASGYRGGRVTIPLNLVPDDHPIAGGARLELIYSYAAQTDVEKSRLDVSVNGAAAGGVALRDVNGRNRVKLLLELPAHVMGPESRLDIDFSLIGKEEQRCLPDKGDPLWGTVHSDSRITLPRDRWSYVPDLGMLRFGAFPFGLRPDLGDTVFVLRDNPSRTELQFFVWLAAEMGRAARGDRFAYDVLMGSVEGAKDTGKHVVLVDSGPDGDLIQRLGLLESMSFTPKGPPGVSLALASGGMVALGADPKIAYIEQVDLPWNPDLTGIVAYAADATLFERVGRCLDRESLFDRLNGKVTRVGSCADIAAIPAEERRILGEKPVRESAYEPIRNNYWLLVAGIAIGIVFVLAVRGFWVSLGRRREYEEEEADYGDA